MPVVAYGVQMIVREHPDGRLCLPQSQHAAISGQMARAWGNGSFREPSPRTEVCLAAERHDDGMDPHDEAPERDPGTGFPRDFMRMPLGSWLDCWERGPAAVAADSPYAGILVSLHGVHLLGYRRLEQESPELRERARVFEADQEELRGRLRESAVDDPECAPHLDAASLERNRALIALWDALSLAVCMPRIPDTFEAVRGDGERVELEVREVGEPGIGETLVEVDPWPFSVPEVPLAAAGRLLREPFGDEAEMREALEASKPLMLTLTLLEPKDADSVR